MAWHRRPTPPGWATLRAQTLEAHDYTCHLCGHEGGVLEVDHLLNTRRGGSHDPSNLAPIHGSAFGSDPCPTCGRHCHQEKTKQEQAAGRAAMTRNRTAEQHPGRIT